MRDDGRPILYSYWLNDERGHPPFTYTSSGFFNWGAWSVWNRQYVAIRYINDSNQPVRFNSVGLRIVACNSGGSSFWSSSGVVDHSGGWGATYTMRIFVCNTPGASSTPVDQWHTLTYEEATVAVKDVPDADYNMNYRGTSTSNTAMFGEPPYDFPMQKFTFDTCPNILPGGFAIVRLEITDRKGGFDYSRDPTIRFSMNPLEMEIEFDPQFNPYVWRAYHENGKVVWHLVRPVQVKAIDGWHNIEGDNEI